MPDLAISAILVLGLAVFVAGSVRGFAGFGDALIFMPIGALFLPPVGLLLAYMVVASTGPIPLLPQAWRVVDKKRLAALNIPMLLFVPLGFWLARQVSPEIFRLITAGLAVLVAVLMISGWKPKINPSLRNIAIAGALSGFVGGLSGVPGAILIFFFLNASIDVAQIRATISLTLFIYALAIVACVVAFGDFDISYIAVAAFLIPIYIIGGLIGKKLFRPEKATLFRAIALAAMLFSGILSMPYGFLMSQFA